MLQENINDIFVIRLKNLLSENCMTYSELAQKIGVSKSAISMWVSKKSMPRMDLLKKIADVFSVTPDDLLKQNFTFGENLKIIREQKGLSQSELGERLGVRQQTVAQYEKAEEQPKMKTIRRLASALNVPLYKLVTNWKEFSSDEFCEDFASSSVRRNEPESTLAAHFDGEEYTEEELNEIRQFAAFVKSKRNAAAPDQDEPEALNAANDRGATPEEKKNADDIMHDPDEWE